MVKRNNKILDTMHIFVGIITDDFHTGSWTDQEIGYAYKRKTPRIFIKIGTSDPQGFVSPEQALNANWNNIHTKIIEHLEKDKVHWPPIDYTLGLANFLYSTGLFIPSPE